MCLNGYIKCRLRDIVQLKYIPVNDIGYHLAGIMLRYSHRSNIDTLRHRDNQSTLGIYSDTCNAWTWQLRCGHNGSFL